MITYFSHINCLQSKPNQPSMLLEGTFCGQDSDSESSETNIGGIKHHPK